MNQEIEYKFLVDKKLWEQCDKPEPQQIIQFYLHKSKELSTRIRIKGNKAFITVKGKTVGVTRSEFEYQIPVDEAMVMMDLYAKKHIKKLRYEIPLGAHIWEIDVFQDSLEGLILAEIELESEDESFEHPIWITEDVSTNPEYYNTVLIDKA